MSKSIPDEFRDLFAKRAYASLGTLRSDGWPQVTPFGAMPMAIPSSSTLPRVATKTRIFAMTQGWR